jgi:hypothetical protein
MDGAEKDFVVWEFEDVPHSFVLDRLRGVQKVFELVEGIPRAAGFSTEARFSVDPDFPNEIGLVDAFTNTYHFTLISEKLKEFITSHKPKAVEFLPVTLLDHKSRAAGKYFILHPIDPVNALDIDESGVTWDLTDNTIIDGIKRIVLKDSALDKTRLLLKLKHFYDYILVRRDLADAISAQGFTGIRWVECRDFSRGGV